MNPLTKARTERNWSKYYVASQIKMHRSNYALIEKRMDAGEAGTIPKTAIALEKLFGNMVTRDQILFPKLYMPEGAASASMAEQEAKAS